ncbi:esterase E4-like isoform X2 [Cloeon dipterum]|uniref:esterase E4-like isoform X2 n=1 Tax=Cloeon dipterum TaxID=197152 RepID=UPI00321FCE73
MHPLVTTRQGTLQGKVLRSRKGRDVCAFQGIPYAAPPVGELRFQEPQEAPSWSGVRTAQKDGSVSTQKDFFTGQFVGSEDCLYLNVYKPAEKENEIKLPCMVWIHGGGFFAGSGSSSNFGPEFLLDHDVVLVTFNYRLGTLGFLNLDTSGIVGNLGLRDQVAALKWVNNNIAAFGGDPGAVTVFGESAGGASVHCLLVSPLAKGLFHRAIIQSGSAFNPWALSEQDEAKKYAQEVCQKLIGNHETKDKEFITKLKAVPAERCAEEGNQLKQKYKLKTELGPTIESAANAFLPAHPESLPVADVPLIIGVTSHEGLCELQGGVDFEKHYKENITDFVPWKELGISKDSPECKKIWQEIDDFYEKLAGGDFLEKYTHINSDIDFMKGVDDLVRKIVTSESRKAPVFYYQFCYDGNLTFYKKKRNIVRKGACHTDEVGYLLTRDAIPWEKIGNEDDFKVTENITKLWTNFATSGNPTPEPVDEVIWEPVKRGDDDSQAVTQFLEIDKRLSMHPENMNEERLQFWRNLLLNKL